MAGTEVAKVLDLTLPAVIKAEKFAKRFGRSSAIWWITWSVCPISKRANFFCTYRYQKRINGSFKIVDIILEKGQVIFAFEKQILNLIKEDGQNRESKIKFS